MPGKNRRLLFAAVLFAATAGALSERSASGASSEWARYLERANTLKQYRDGDELNEADVLKVLRQAGVFEPLGGTEPGSRSFASGFRPFEVRVYKGLWRWPLKYGIVSSEYGRRWGRRHQGIDIAADTGDKVLAAAPGEVLYASSSLKGYGNVVILRHDNDTTSLYAHNDSIAAKKGQRVRSGQIIAHLGSSGRSTGPHVHFEVRKGGKAVDPRKVLPKSRF